MIVSEVQHRFDGETSVLTPHSGGGSKLIFNSVLINNFEQAPAQDATENFGPHVHQSDSTPLVWIRKVSTLGDWYYSSFVPFREINFSSPISVEKTVEEIEVLVGERLKGVWRYVVQTR